MDNCVQVDQCVINPNAIQIKKNMLPTTETEDLGFTIDVISWLI